MNDDRIDMIVQQITELRAELRDYAKITVANQTDLRWIRGSAQTLATIISACVSIVVTYLLKTFGGK